MPRKAGNAPTMGDSEPVDGVKLVEARINAADRLLSVRTKLLNLGIGGRNPDQEEYLIATLVGVGAGALSVWPEVVKTLEKAEKMDWDRAVAVAPADGRVKSIAVKNFGSFENLYGELVEPWLGPWAQLRETYARYRKGEITADEGAKLLTRSEAGKLGGRGNKAPYHYQELSGYGTGKDYTLARLRRDDPELAARVERGELTANAAAVEKGWRKPPNAYRTLVNAWRRAAPEERDRFEEYIGAWRREKGK